MCIRDRQSSSGLLETLTQLFNYPDEQHLITRGSPVSAPNPCLTILGATTYEWFEGAFREDNIHGGVANRFLYFYNPPSEEETWVSYPIDKRESERVATQLKNLRAKFGESSEQTAFRWTQEAYELGKAWYSDYRKRVKAENNPFVGQALGRADLYLKKSALIHAILTNTPGDTQLHPESAEWAIGVQEYLIETAAAIYGEFNTSHQKRVEEGILKVLRSSATPDRMSAREIWRTKGMRFATNKDVIETLNILVRVQQVEFHDESHTNRYSITAEEE